MATRAARSQGKKKRVARAGTVVEIPDKPFFKIGEVAALADVEPYVLRYWETEFKQWIRPEKTRTGQRMYRRKDVEVVMLIRRMLKEEGYRIDGARKKLRELEGPVEAPPAPGIDPAVLDGLRAEIDALEKILDEDERVC
jgi:DNA-binding transcriptional MerR regulator